ncbi:MAG: transporter [Gammaproteobacteria bacterium]|jgi:hypothetical protein
MHKFQSTRVVQLALLVSALSVLQQAGAQEASTFKFSTGVDYSSGDYGDPIDTDILYVPFTFTYERYPVTMKLSLSWLEIQGPGGVVGGGDAAVVVRPGTGVKTTESGFGDTWFSLGYSVDAIPAELFYLDLIAKVKFPTGDDDRGLGTGERDYTLQADFFKSLGRFSPLATVAYKIKGDPPGLELDDVWYISVGGAYQLNDATSMGLTLDYQEASTAAADDALELFGYVTYKVTPAWSLTGYGYGGFTDGSPDQGFGAQVGYSFEVP